MATENKAIVYRFFEEIFNQQAYAVVDEIVAVAYINHNPAPNELPGRDGLKQFAAYFHSGSEDARFVIEDQIAEGDKVATRWTATGTHTGEYADIPATGKHSASKGINIHRMVDGQIQEGWLEWDALGWLQQISVIPAEA